MNCYIFFILFGCLSKIILSAFLSQEFLFCLKLVCELPLFLFIIIQFLDFSSVTIIFPLCSEILTVTAVTVAVTAVTAVNSRDKSEPLARYSLLVQRQDGNDATEAQNIFSGFFH